MAADVLHGRWTEGWTRRDLLGFWGGLVVYGALLALGRGGLDEGDPDWQRWAVAGGTIAAALLSLSFMVRAIRRSKEVDRLVVTESTSLAFMATMTAALTYGLLESIVDLPRLTAWSTWMFGMGAWVVTGLVVRRARL